MSYDVSITVPAGPDDEVEAFDGNYTSNVSWMWTEALGLPERPYLRDGEQVIGSRLNRETGEWEQVPIYDRGLRLLDGAPCADAASRYSYGTLRVHS